MQKLRFALFKVVFCITTWLERALFMQVFGKDCRNRHLISSLHCRSTSGKLGAAAHSVIPALERLKQQDHHEAENSMGYLVRSCLKKVEKKRNQLNNNPQGIAFPYAFYKLSL